MVMNARFSLIVLYVLGEVETNMSFVFHIQDNPYENS